jgi:hypothetical protein
MMQRPIIALVGVAAVLAAGCGGSSSSGGGLTSCALPSGTQTVLVYPAPGSVGIPDNIPQIVFGSTTALPSGFSAYIVDTTTQNAFAFGNVVAASLPLPAPNTTPTFANPVYQASTNSGVTLSGGTSVSVYVDNLSGGCIIPTSLGSFTVQ